MADGHNSPPGFPERGERRRAAVATALGSGPLGRRANRSAADLVQFRERRG